VAEEIRRRCLADVVALHDRRVPGSRANIDHIVIAPSGVWVVDTKCYKGRVEVRAPLFGSARLKIAGRDKTRLVHVLDRYCEMVRAAVDRIASDVPVHSAFCFVGSELPMLGTRSIGGHRLLQRRSLTRRLNRRGPLLGDRAAVLVSELSGRFPPVVR
jgi:hypothetical protein